MSIARSENKEISAMKFVPTKNDEIIAKIHNAQISLYRKDILPLLRRFTNTQIPQADSVNRKIDMKIRGGDEKNTFKARLSITLIRAG